MVVYGMAVAAACLAAAAVLAVARSGARAPGRGAIAAVQVWPVNRQQQLFSIIERSPPSHGTGANDDPFLNLNPPLNPAISEEGTYGEYDLYSNNDPPIYKKSGLAMLRGVRPRMQLEKKQDPLPGFIPTYKVGGDPLPGFIPTFKAPARRQAPGIDLPREQFLELDFQPEA
jgi:hypothetical protein